jgi:DNA helicase HerA-like ATPase
MVYNDLIDIFEEAKMYDNFVGRPFSLDYDHALILIADAWKMNVGGIPQGTFLLAFYENEENVSEALLLRALKPTKLPTENDIISSMIEYYKDDLKTSGKESKLDDFTRYEFSFSGLKCSILGTFYKDVNGKTMFGADVENFYSAHNYNVYKPLDEVLKTIVNLREDENCFKSETDIKIGNVRYSSSLRFQGGGHDVPVYINPQDFLGKRTALFGMTRTGKSNTAKKIIEATVEISRMKSDLDMNKENIESNLEPFNEKGLPKLPTGQIIFDINGEYANANLQDDGTAIFELFKEDVDRYSVVEKEGFNVMKVNFYNEIESGFDLIKSYLEFDRGDYVSSFKAVDLSKPDDPEDFSAKTRYKRKAAAYLCCLSKAGFKAPKNFIIKFEGNKELNKMVRSDGRIDPKEGISLKDATKWFTRIWDNYKDSFFKDYQDGHGHEWADEDLKAILAFLTRKKTPGGTATVSGYKKLRGIIKLHTSSSKESFEQDIIKSLRKGKIIIVDLSQGDPEIQTLYAERICQKIFQDSMDRFTQNRFNNFIQFYFEEAHNLFPKKEDKDLSQIYNRIAKEGAKLNLGLIYATQEVSSISANILKNTQNWFISHLNNEDELRELRKYYDFADFIESLMRFSPGLDKGFARIKTYSNPFIVPVQIDRFTAKKE